MEKILEQTLLYDFYGELLTEHQKQIYELYLDDLSLSEIANELGISRQGVHDLIKRCIESWKKVLPEYEVVLWNEDNFPYEEYPFAQQALKDRKWAFVSDVARLHALYYNGGIYMDTDVEMIKPLDKFLEHGFFSSFESKRHLPTGLMGAKKGNLYVKLLLDWYRDKSYGKDFYEIANTRIITRITRMNCGIKINGEQYKFADNCYYTRHYFCPELVNGKWNVTNNTCCIHHFTGLW